MVSSEDLTNIEGLMTDAVTCLETGQNTAAGSIFGRVAAILADHGHFDQAATFWETALDLENNNTDDGWFSIVANFSASGKIEIAKYLYHRILETWPYHCKSLLGLGGIYDDAGAIEIAKSYYLRAIEVDETFSPALYNLARIMRQSDNLSAAMLYERVLPGDYLYGQAQFEAGSLYVILENYSKVVACFQACLTCVLLPDRRATCLAYIAYARVMGGLGTQAEINRAVEAWAEGFLPLRRELAQALHPAPGQPLRISLCTAGLGATFPFPLERVAHALCLAFRRQGVESWIYALANDLPEALPDHCVDLRKLTMQEAYEVIEKDKNHVLLTMDFMPVSDISLYLMRPAPIILGWWHCISSQGGMLDGILIDSWYVPADMVPDFSDNIYWLRGSSTLVIPNEHAPDVTPPPCLSSGYITFGSFNRPSKIDEEVVELWASALKSVHGSRLYLRSSSYSEQERDRVLCQFEKNGILRERIQIFGRTDYADFLKSYSQIDIALDTIHFTGGITTVETLWQGVPLISLPGKLLSSRISSSILAGAGLECWIARDKAHWLELVVGLAADPRSLQEWRTNLRGIMANSSAANPDLMAQELIRAVTPAINALPMP